MSWKLVTFTYRNMICLVRLISLKKMATFYVFLFFFWKRPFSSTYLGHFLTDLPFLKIISDTLPCCSLHSLIFIWKFWKIRSGHSVETCMSLICDFRSLLCPNAECHSAHGMFTTVDPMYIWQLMLKMIRTGGMKEFGRDGQQVSESGSDWVSHCMRERVHNKRCGQRDGFWRQY